MGALGEELDAEVKKTFATGWSERNGKKVPEPDEVGLGNDCVKVDGVVLYADLAESTNLVDSEVAHFAAEVYKTYLHCAAKIIRAKDGVITSYDGDRIMAVFDGENPNTRATKAALQINYAVTKIINPRLQDQYPHSQFVVRHAVGIDNCTLHVANTGIRGSHDLVWVGRAANYAAKLCGLRVDNYATWITESVYKRLHASSKFANGDENENMWEKSEWKEYATTVYRSSYRSRI